MSTENTAFLIITGAAAASILFGAIFNVVDFYWIGILIISLEWAILGHVPAKQKREPGGPCRQKTGSPSSRC